MGIFVFLIFVLILAKAWPLILLILVGALLRALYLHFRRGAERGAQIRRSHEAGLGRRIARTQREIARTDAALGLGSAPLSAVNADTLERLAQADAKVH